MSEMFNMPVGRFREFAEAIEEAVDVCECSHREEDHGSDDYDFDEGSWTRAQRPCELCLCKHYFEG